MFYADLRIHLREMQKDLRAGLDRGGIRKADERSEQMSGLWQLEGLAQAFAVSGQDLEEKLSDCRAGNSNGG
jgi:hypothetical protein